MMPKHADAFIGFRVPLPVKASWQEQADQEHRSLSNWIIHRLETERPGSEKRPRQLKKALAS